MVTDGTFSITKAANPTKIICGIRSNDGTLIQVRGAIIFLGIIIISIIFKKQ